MDSVTKNFITEMFLDSDSVLSVNRLVVAVAKLVNESSENISSFDDIYNKEYQDQVSVPSQTKCDVFPVIRRVKKLYEETVSNFTDEDYLELFKMKKSTVEGKNKSSRKTCEHKKTFDILLMCLLLLHAETPGQIWNGDSLYSNLTYQLLFIPENPILPKTAKKYYGSNISMALVKFLQDYTKSASIVPLEKKVHVFLWLLTNSSSCKEIGLLFNLHKSTVNAMFHEIATLLTEQRYHFINWPTIDEQHLTRIKVNSRFKFPNSVGFIDACRLKVSSIRKRKSKPEIVLLQAVCDESLMFTDIHVGQVGNTRKGRVFRESQLAQELKNFVDFENHILGDSQYKLRKNLITPFSSEELLTSEEMKFNEIHWKARSYIGHAFELLKERFRKLNNIDINRPETVKTLISAACVLHNFILLHEGCSEVKEEAIVCDDGVIIDTSLVKTATEKRQFLCNYINYLEST